MALLSNNGGCVIARSNEVKALALAHTPRLNRAAQTLLAFCYQPGFRYWKARVLVEELIPATNVPPCLLAVRDTSWQARLIQGRFG